MITRLRNANLVKSRFVYILKSNLTVRIAEILKSEGFIEDFELVNSFFIKKKGFYDESICIRLKFKGFDQKPYINCIKRISKPGVRVYTNSLNIPKVLGGIGIAVFF